MGGLPTNTNGRFSSNGHEKNGHFDDLHTSKTVTENSFDKP
jgi:hypothetical protein